MNRSIITEAQAEAVIFESDHRERSIEYVDFFPTKPQELWYVYHFEQGNSVSVNQQGFIREIPEDEVIVP